MVTFTYEYQGNPYESTLEYYSQDGGHRYRVVSPEAVQYFITVLGIARLNGKLIWLQSNKKGEIIQPHELNQAIGEAVEKTELFRQTFDEKE